MGQTSDTVHPAPSCKYNRFRRRLIFIGLCIPLGVLIHPRVLGNLILRAADKGDASQVRLLLRGGANPNSFGWYIPTDQTPLMLAASRGSLPTVRVLVDHGADINTGVNDWSYTPLMCAAEGGNPAVVRLLIARGAHLDAINGNGETPLTLARSTSHPEIVQALKWAGAKEVPKP